MATAIEVGREYGERCVGVGVDGEDGGAGEAPPVEMVKKVEEWN